MFKTIGTTLFDTRPKCTISGTYTDDSSRFIDLYVIKDDDNLWFSRLMQGTVCYASMMCGFGDTSVMSTVGIRGWVRDPSDAARLIVRIDRGYFYYRYGLPQPDTYPIPLSNGILFYSSPESPGIEASEWAIVSHKILGIGSPSLPVPYQIDGESGIVSPTNPESVGVSIEACYVWRPLGFIHTEATEQSIDLLDIADDPGASQVVRVFINSAGSLCTYFGPVFDPVDLVSNTDDMDVQENTLRLTNTPRGLNDGTCVQVSGMLTETGLSPNTDYYVVGLGVIQIESEDFTVFSLSEEYGGDPIPLSSPESSGSINILPLPQHPTGSTHLARILITQGITSIDSSMIVDERNI